ncbi:hypothetical protein TRFO_02375 [Tritrichomonas foetus]|uniref:Uncharacterized protein n=1 Tax=Tritrichomonas foetus TaxID=1144522 RepID=A0A1J4J577_9EUKA|nr:hypothetical protein TRFO_02375 [Tritrichomonas foetus]|eukprot:OHS93849.1 hypothetical protein TRFO_02375 [Tritrichomonas foetus]
MNYQEENELFEETPEETYYESPDDLLEKIEAECNAFQKHSAKSEYDIKEQNFQRRIAALETRTLQAEEENLLLKNQIAELRDEISSAKSNSYTFQAELIDSNDKYDCLVKKLFHLFHCNSLDEVFQCSDRIIEQESKINHLSENLCKVQFQFSAETLKSIDRGPSVNGLESEEIERLNNSLQRAEETIDKQNKEIIELKSKIEEMTKRDDQIQGEYASLKVSIGQLTLENQNLEKLNQNTIQELTELKTNQPKQLIEANRRLSFLNSISKRFEPKFLCINENSSLFKVFDTLSMLMQSISDLEIDTQTIMKCLIEMNVVTREASNKIDTSISNLRDLHQIVNHPNQKSDNISSEKVKELEAQIKELTEQKAEYEDELEYVKGELQDMQENDKTPECAMWMAKYKKLETEVKMLRKLQNQSPNSSKLPPRRPLATLTTQF